MSFERCRRLDPSSLAVRGSSAELVGFWGDIDAHSTFWLGTRDRAENEADIARYMLALTLRGELAEASADIIDPRIARRNRQRVLGALGVSKLIQRIVTPEMILFDRGSRGR